MHLSITHLLKVDHDQLLENEGTINNTGQSLFSEYPLRIRLNS